jgi:CheY-like chemotaxis protein
MTDINVISNILLVDDDHTSVFIQNHLLTNVCKFEGNIQTCYNGKEALDYIESKGKFANGENSYPRPNLILLDINMPVMNGFEFLEAYTQLPEDLKGGIVISMLTSSVNESDREKAKAFEELSEFITKPLNQDELMNIVGKHFG